MLRHRYLPTYQFNTNSCGPGMAGLVGSGCFRASRRVFCGPKCPAYVRYAVHTHLPLKKAPQIRWFRSTNKNRFACVTPQRHQRPQLRLLRPRKSPHLDRRASCALARAMRALNSPMFIPSTPNFQRACIARRCVNTHAECGPGISFLVGAPAAPVRSTGRRDHVFHLDDHHHLGTTAQNRSYWFRDLLRVRS